MRCTCSGVTYNRTKVELKLLNALLAVFAGQAYNRTKVELKPVDVYVRQDSVCAL